MNPCGLHASPGRVTILKKVRAANPPKVPLFPGLGWAGCENCLPEVGNLAERGDFRPLNPLVILAGSDNKNFCVTPRERTLAKTYPPRERGVAKTFQLFQNVKTLCFCRFFETRRNRGRRGVFLKRTGSVRCKFCWARIVGIGQLGTDCCGLLIPVVAVPGSEESCKNVNNWK